MKHTFDIKDTDPLLLFGVNDQHIQILTNTFKAQVVARGGLITVEGAGEDVQRVEQVLRDMILTINRKGSLTPEDVSALVKVSTDGQPPPGPGR